MVSNGYSFSFSVCLDFSRLKTKRMNGRKEQKEKERKEGRAGEGRKKEGRMCFLKTLKGVGFI